MALPYHMYVLATRHRIDLRPTWNTVTTCKLLLLVLGMNLIAIILRDRLQKRR